MRRLDGATRTEVIAKWWLPHTLYYADYQRDGVFRVWCDGCCLAMNKDISLEAAAEWSRQNGYIRLGDAP